MRSKLVFVFFSLFNFLVTAQDSIPVTADPTLIQGNIKLDESNIEERHFEPDFKSKYQEDDFIYEVKLDTKKSWWDRFKEWLTEVFNSLFNFKDGVEASNFVDVFIKIFAGCLIVIVIYLIVKSIMNGEGQWIFGKASDKKMIQYQETERNIHLINFEQLIKQSLKNNEHRLVIRYYYLWVLKVMSEKNIIEWDPEKTNSDYILEIQNAKIKEQFSYASYLYNYIWYGEFELDQEGYTKAETAFENLLKSI
jgi:hypothetical protein